jgi:hypothetical protein
MNDTEQVLSYKSCTILYSSRLDTDLLKYVPNAAITWKTDSGTMTTWFLRSLQPEPTKTGAESMALEEAKAWIDRVKPAASTK